MQRTLPVLSPVALDQRAGPETDEHAPGHHWSLGAGYGGDEREGASRDDQPDSDARGRCIDPRRADAVDKQGHGTDHEELVDCGLKPADAALETLRRVVASTEPRLLDDQGRPTFNLSFYAVNKNGEFGAASIWPGQYAAFDGRMGALLDRAHLYEREA